VSDVGSAAPAGPEEWAGRFSQQADACDELGSPLWGRLLRIVADDVAAEGASWAVMGERADLRFGQAGPLRLLGAAHRLALSGAAPAWAALLPSCGGTAPAPGPSGDAELRDAWVELVGGHGGELVAGLDREVQTNEVARSAALAFAQSVVFASPSPSPSPGFGGGFRRYSTKTTAKAGVGGSRLVEIGCSGGLNLRLDRFRIDLGGATAGIVVLGDPDGPVRLAPEVRSPVDPDVEIVPIVERVGIDPHPIDPSTEDGRLTLLSFVWPDQTERFERLAAAIDLARSVPATLLPTGGRRTSEVLEEVLARPVEPGTMTVVQHSIVWQYIPTDQRPEVTAVIERAGEVAGADTPLAWVRMEPDEWDRRRAAVHVRRWPGGGDRLVAHADFHGRWLAPVGLT